LNRPHAGFILFGLLLLLPAQLLSGEKVRIETFDPPVDILGYTCQEARYRENGLLYRVDLAEPDTLLKWIIPARSMIHFLEDGVTPKYVFLAENTWLDSLPCRGLGHNWMTTFHPDGGVKTVWLFEDTEIQGLLVRKATFWRAVRQKAETRFHPDGRLALAWLARDAVLDGQRFRRGDMVQFDQEGSIQNVRQSQRPADVH